MWLLVASIFIGLVIYTEVKKNKFDIFSPFCLLCLPTLILMLLSFGEERIFGYLAVSQPAAAIFLFCSFFFWVGSRIAIVFSPRHKNIMQSNVLYIDKRSNVVIKTISYLFLAILLVNLNSILGNRSFLQLDDEEFAQNGLVGHVGELIVFYIVYYIAALKEKSFDVKKIVGIGMIVVLLGLKVLISIKAQAVIPFVAGILYLLMRGYIKVNVLSFVVGILGIFALFTIPAVLFNAKDTSVPFISSYFVFYMYAGISGLTAFLNGNPTFTPGGAPLFLFRFVINFFSKFFGDGTMERFAVAPDYCEIYTANAMFPHSSNVAMLFGEVYLNTGPLITALFFMFIGYIFYLIYFSYKKHLILTIMYAYIGANLVMALFSSYIINQTFIETTVFAYLMYLIAKRKKRTLPV